MSILALRAGLLAGAVALLCAVNATAGDGPQPQPFAQFLRGLHMARASDYVGRPGAVVKDAAALEEMRRHLLQLYRGVTATRSFAADGAVFDCIPIGQQPGLRHQGSNRPAPPPAPSPSGTPAAEVATQAPRCDAGTIPMRRLTLAEMTRFATLQDFLHKAPGSRPGVDQPPRADHP